MYFISPVDLLVVVIFNFSHFQKKLNELKAERNEIGRDSRLIR